jgi:hypothetical protein
MMDKVAPDKSRPAGYKKFHGIQSLFDEVTIAPRSLQQGRLL